MPTILLAEANRELRDAYHAFLSRCGFQVDTAQDGLECLAKLRQSVPNVLILDLDLPWGGGDGVLAFLREEQDLLPNRIVLTSANETAHQFVCLQSPPVVKTLPKPFPLSDLLEHAEPGPSQVSQHTSDGGGRRRGVLVVDDEPFVRELLEWNLHYAGFHVWTAGSGERRSIIAANIARRSRSSFSTSRCPASTDRKLSRAFEAARRRCPGLFHDRRIRHL